MSRRRRRRKPRGPGVYQNPDGSTTTIVEANGMLIETKVRPCPRPGEAKRQVISRVPVKGPPAGVPVSGLEQAPTIRTNAIPGEKGIHDYATGIDFSRRADYDRYYKQHNLVDYSGKEGAIRNEAPSYAQEPKRESNTRVRGFDPAGMPPGGISDSTIMTNETRSRVFGGPSLPRIGRR